MATEVLRARVPLAGGVRAELVVLSTVSDGDQVATSLPGAKPIVSCFGVGGLPGSTSFPSANLVSGSTWKINDPTGDRTVLLFLGDN